ncbi:MAG: tRNA pseudouridine(55) synthase TruB, partial [Methylovirgula sp.]
EKEAVRLTELSEAPEALLSVEAGLTEMPRVAVDRESAARLRRGQSILLRGREAPIAGQAYASCGGVVVAVGAIEHGELVPGRVFNLPF